MSRKLTAAVSILAMGLAVTAQAQNAGVSASARPRFSPERLTPAFASAKRGMMKNATNAW